MMLNGYKDDAAHIVFDLVDDLTPTLFRRTRMPICKAESCFFCDKRRQHGFIPFPQFSAEYHILFVSVSSVWCKHRTTIILFSTAANIVIQGSNCATKTHHDRRKCANPCRLRRSWLIAFRVRSGGNRYFDQVGLICISSSSDGVRCASPS